MSKYTTEVRFVCETYAGLTESEGYNSIDTIINKSMDKIFDFSYPIYDENYKRVLQAKILKHYYTREIGAETVGLWKLFLSRRLNEIMPYYNKLYETELLNFNPLYDVDLTTTHTRTGAETGQNTESKNENKSFTGDQTKTISSHSTTNSNDTGTIEDEGSKSNTKTLNTSTTTTDSGTEGKTGSDIKKNDHWDIYSDTPQGALTNIKTGDGAYLTNARHVTDDGTGSSFSETTTFGKTTTAIETGTVSDAETNDNTRTLDTETNSETSEQGTDKTKTTNTDTASSSSNSSHDINSTEEYIEHVTGKTGSGTFAKMILEFRETLLNIDVMIINELSDLFFNLW